MEQLKGILFIDIETVPVVRTYDELNEPMQKEWTRKSRLIKYGSDEMPDPAVSFNEKSGVYSEFAKVVCIGIGSAYEREGKWKIRLKSLTSTDEKVLLKQFLEVLDRFYQQNKDFRFCGHNIKEFDIPFLCRRLVINGLPLPNYLQFYGKKPWEVNHIDTMELWKFGDYKNYTSLSLLAAVLGIPSPKSDLDGSMVAGVFYNDNNLERIAMYCLQDVFTSAKVYLKLAGDSQTELEAEYA